MGNKGKYINRSNYEIWFIDYVEGTLSDEQIQLLALFLDENPDLRSEAEGLSEITLPVQSDVHFPHKSRLKKATIPVPHLSEYEYLAIKSIEEGLSRDEQQRLDYLLHKNPQLKRDLHLFRNTKLGPGSYRMPNLRRLMRRSLFARSLPFIKSAAAIVLVVLLFNYRQHVPTSFMESDLVTIQPETVEPINHKPETPVVYSIANNYQEPLEIKTTPREQSLNDDQPLETEAYFAESITIKPLPGPAMQLIDELPAPNAYETGLSLMLPMYVENRRLIAQLNNYSYQEISDTKNLLDRTTAILRTISPLNNITYNKIYDHEGELVAINLSSENFELTQKVPRWLGTR